MENQRDLDFLRNYRPSKDDFKMKDYTKNPFISFKDEAPHRETPTPDKSTKFFSVEVEVITHQGYGKGRYNFMDDNWIVELYDEPCDELQSYTGVTHWRELNYKTEEERITFQFNRDILKGFNLI